MRACGGHACCEAAICERKGRDAFSAAGARYMTVASGGGDVGREWAVSIKKGASDAALCVEPHGGAPKLPHRALPTTPRPRGGTALQPRRANEMCSVERNRYQPAAKQKTENEKRMAGKGMRAAPPECEAPRTEREAPEHPRMCGSRASAASKLRFSQAPRKKSQRTSSIREETPAEMREDEDDALGAAEAVRSRGRRVSLHRSSSPPPSAQAPGVRAALATLFEGNP